MGGGAFFLTSGELPLKMPAYIGEAANELVLAAAVPGLLAGEALALVADSEPALPDDGLAGDP